MRRISIMQPYFLPYAGYFRLMCNVDAFVVLDGVQFPRRGWVHRNRLKTFDDNLSWLTLPLIKMPLRTRIAELRFRDTARDEIDESKDRFPAIKAPADQSEPLVEALLNLQGKPSDFLVRLLELTREAIGFSVPLLSAPPMDLPQDAGPSDRVIAICRHFSADTYVNAPGGRAIYDAVEFRKHGIDLFFLPPYRGPMDSILQRLHETRSDAVRREILANLN